MTPLTRESVATLAGRELDVAVWRAMTPNRCMWCPKHGVCWGDHIANGIHIDNGCGLAVIEWDHHIPHFSEEGPAFFTLLAALRERGWTIEMAENLSPDEEGNWLVHLTFCHGGQHAHRRAFGDTLPQALARAAVMTTIDNNGEG